MVEIVNVADLRDPQDPHGRSYRQVNALRTHAIPLGALVELDGGERLRVMKHTRDCDQTPLYSLGVADSSDWTWNHGYCDDSLTVVPPNAMVSGRPEAKP